MPDAPLTSDAPPRTSGAPILILILLIIAVAAAFTLLPLKDWFESLRAQIQALGWTGFFVYVAVYILCATLLIPCTAMGLMGGYLFGLALGVPAAILGGNLGAWSAFFFGRTIFRRRVERWAFDKPRYTAVERAVADNGLKVVFLMRLSPIFGYTVMNYLLSLTAIPFWKFALATVLGMLPGNFAFVYIGTLPATISQGGADGEKPPAIRVLQVAGICAVFAVTVILSRIARKALKQVAA